MTLRSGLQLKWFDTLSDGSSELLLLVILLVQCFTLPVCAAAKAMEA